MAYTSRPRHREKTGDEEAEAVLKLGEFQDTATLSHSEARLIIAAIVKNRQGSRANRETETLIKTTDYLDMFSRFKQQDNVDQVEVLLRPWGDLVRFEKSQLGSLCCETADEAKTLIPSLQDKISDVDLQDVLDEITKLRNFTEG